MCCKKERGRGGNFTSMGTVFLDLPSWSVSRDLIPPDPISQRIAHFHYSKDMDQVPGKFTTTGVIFFPFLSSSVNGSACVRVA